ncbi:MAG: hypothetical protein F4X91_16265 [Nitrospinae bacterium]|nr:hypothetical protein [Nitrospinota bacterium]
MNFSGDGWGDGGMEGPGFHYFPPGENPDLTPFAEMSGRALRRVIERMDLEILVLALRNAQPRVVERVLRNVSSKNAAHIREEIERADSGESERSVEARQMLMQTAYAMKNHGDITFDGPADDAIPPLDRTLEEGLAAFHSSDSKAEHAVSLIVALAAWAEQHGLLSLEPALERSPDGIFSTGLRMLVDQAPWDEAEMILARQIESSLGAVERNKEIAIEGALAILDGVSEDRARARLVAFLPEGEADYERLPGVRFSPSAQATVDIISLCVELAGLASRDEGGAIAERLEWIQEPLLKTGLKWALEGATIEDVERLLSRKGQTRLDRERRKLECLAEGFMLIREGHPVDFIREALGGYIEDEA